ncbi:metaxin-1a isoform X1 [Alosa sapidissima]|uniref:metaxin-1a isoform X1 n=1 Tax=Alosa sapidissima TaxID=34773 RepID=UPI001C085BD9|nr:metaxin-1a isoform X1 [Alosa sapidissima]XP_041962458.1 metaxin-1a isoform X1 [Alosa sapidissima]
MATPLELFCWKGNWGLPSVNTECLIVLAYARFAGVPLKLHKTANPWGSPTGILPALKTQENGSFSQPSKIIIEFRKQKYNADFDLSAKEGADTLAFISLVEEKLMPALIYALWVDPKNYVEVTRRWHGDNIPFPLNFFLPSRMQRQQLARLRLIKGDETLEAGEDMEKELYHDAQECMDLLSQRLGSSKFFFGDSPSSLDAYVFGHLAPLLKIKLPCGRLQQHLKSLDNLTRFCSNILTLYFPSEPNEGTAHKVSTQPEANEFDNEPNKRRKQLLSLVFALGAMLSYALLTGIVSIEHVPTEEDLREPQGIAEASPGEDEE